MSKWGDDKATIYFETRQELLEGMIKMGAVSEDELNELSDKQQNFVLLHFNHDHDIEGCVFCSKLDDLSLKERDYERI